MQLALQDFELAEAATAEAESAVAEAIAAGEEALAVTGDESVADPQVLADLRDALDHANQVGSLGVAEPANDVAGLRTQIASMTEAATGAQEAAGAVTGAMNAVTESVRAKEEADQAAEDAIGKGDFTITDKVGYLYRFEFDAAVNVVQDTTEGKPGNVMMRISTMDSTTGTLTNTTPGKRAPVPEMDFNPLYRENPCEFRAYEGRMFCYTIIVDGTEYWYVQWLTMSFGGVNSFELDVDEAWPWGGNAGNTVEIEVAEGDVAAYTELLSSPVWALTTPSEDGYECIGTAEWDGSSPSCLLFRTPEDS
jgi:hypothetical protein